MATNKRRRADDDDNNATAGANAPPGAPTTPATTNSGGTPGLKGAKPGDSSGSEGTLTGATGAANKKRRVAWSAEAIALGYEAGTIKNSAYVLLAQSGVAGMTVAAIVDAATKQGLYSWGTCKTPNNSVTAALSQDTTFVRIAPSTYALRSTLKGGPGPVPQPRTSSGSINSGLGRAASGSGLSGGAVAGGRSTLGQKAISSKARRIDRAAAMREQQLRAAENAQNSAGYGLDDDGFGGATAMDGGATVSLMHAAPGLMMADGMNGGMMGPGLDRYDGMTGAGAGAGYGAGAGAGSYGAYGAHASKLSSALHLESYKRRTDLLGGIGEDGWAEDDRLGSAFAVLPAARPEHDMEEATAGSSLLWYPTANPPAPPAEKPSPLKEPTEALIRASSWKDEAKSLFSSPGVRDFETEAGLSAMSSGHLPKWVYESFNDGKGSPGAIAC